LRTYYIAGHLKLAACSPRVGQPWPTVYLRICFCYGSNARFYFSLYSSQNWN